MAHGKRRRWWKRDLWFSSLFSILSINMLSLPLPLPPAARTIAYASQPRDASATSLARLSRVVSAPFRAPVLPLRVPRTWFLRLDLVPSTPRRARAPAYAGALPLTTLEPAHFRLRALSSQSPASTTFRARSCHRPSFHARIASTAPMRPFIRALRVDGRVSYAPRACAVVPYTRFLARSALAPACL
ncbi:hypothetical protein DENSPDRAFT_930944, partial [Dentipellis sp. KUC8613]